MSAGRGLAGLALAAAVLVLPACSVAPRSGEPPVVRAPVPERGTVAPPAAAALPPDRAGLGASAPADLNSVPDAEPRIEPIRSGGPNKPYEVLGQSYVPQTRDAPFRQRGMASWYGPGFHGKRTASGEIYNMYAMTAAHPTLPLPSYVRVRNPANGAEVVVRINDRGPFHGGRIIDLSYTAAVKLGVHGGVAPVELERITFDDIRTGAWRRPGGTDLALAPTAATLAPATVAAPAARAAARRSAAPPTPLPRPDPAPLEPAPVTVAVLPTAAADAVDLPVPPADAAPAPGAASALASASTPAPALPTATGPGPAASEAFPATPAAAPAAAVPPGFWVQLGAFQQRAGADGFHRRVAADVHWLAPLLAVFSEPPLHRLQAGPYASRDEALSIAQRVREALKLVPVVLERR